MRIAVVLALLIIAMLAASAPSVTASQATPAVERLA